MKPRLGAAIANNTGAGYRMRRPCELSGELAIAARLPHSDGMIRYCGSQTYLECQRAMSDLILLIEDDSRLAGMVSDFLSQMGFTVEHTPTGEEGLIRLARGGVSAIVLDLMLPGIDGLEVCRRARAASDAAILMLTARGDETDRVVGLEVGADDYLSKPFSPRELVARLRAILRRRNAGPQHQGLLCFGSLEIDPEARLVRLDGVEKSLTSYQFDLLVVLARHAGRVLSRDQIMDLVKGELLEAFDRSIDVHISRIRAAIERDPRRPRSILTIRGVGYLFTRHQDRPDNIQ